MENKPDHGDDEVAVGKGQASQGDDDVVEAVDQASHGGNFFAAGPAAEPQIQPPTPRRFSFLDWFFIVGLWVAAFAISSHDTFQPIRASLALLQSNDFDELLKSGAPFLDVKRTIQAHYLSYGVYIPLDDIVLNAQEKQPLRDLLESACKPGRATVWVPLKFHVPLAGEKVFEWCLVKV